MTKKSLLALIVLFASGICNTINAQTIFQPGDMVPVAYRMNATGSVDEIALLTFINILPGTQINLTDGKFTDNPQPQCAGGLTLITPATTIPAGTVITISTDGNTTTHGSLTGTTFGLSSGGDQVIVYTGTAASPSYITALSSNAWVTGALTACNGSLSKLPLGLTNGVSAISLSAAPGNTSNNTVNAYYNGAQTGSAATLRTSILNPANWVGIGSGNPPQVWPAFNFPGPPQITGSATTSSTTLRLIFNSDLDPVSATTLTNYTGITGLTAATVTSNGNAIDTVVLTFSTPFSGVNTLTVSGVLNSNNVAMLNPYTYTFTYTTSVSFASRYVTRKEGVNATVAITLNVTNPSPSATVQLSLRSGVWSTASIADFNSWPTDTTLSLNATSIALQIPINNDNLNEQDEYAVFSLLNNVNCTITGLPNFTAFVRDNDRTAPVADKSLELSFVGRYTVPNTGGATGLAEIVTYDAASQRLFTMSTGLGKFDIVNFSNPLAPTTITQIDMSSYGSGITSIAVKNGIVAVSVPGLLSEQDPGKVVFFDINGNYLNQVTVGVLPDMVTFTPDGTYVMTANEGQPNDAYTIDPEGSVSMINISGGIGSLSQANVTTLDFTSFNVQEATLIAAGVRKTKSTSTLSQDFEPEYITVSPNSDKAWVTIQENNAIAEINILTQTITSVWPLGTKNYNVFGNGLDASDRGDSIHIANWPLKGFYMPDGIANYNVGGITYLVTANEGDEKEYTGLNERTTVGVSSLDPTAFPNAAVLKENHNLGRTRITNLNGDTDNDGDFDELYCVGGRSFSIWNSLTGTLVFDSGDAIEKITQTHPLTANIFNADNESNAFKGRSRAKGPEPEGVTIGTIAGKTYAFVSVERIGGVMVYDITDPNTPIFTEYQNSRSNTSFAGDNGPEGIIYIPGSATSNGKHYIITANEISGTLAIFEVVQPCNFDLTTQTITACAGQTVNLNAGSSFASYAWSNGANTAITTVTTAGTYYASATNYVGCTSVDSIIVTFNPVPALNVADIAVCAGTTATLNAGAGQTSYLWSNGATTQSISSTVAGSFQVTATNAFNCTASDAATITVNALPVIAIPNLTICNGVTATLNAGNGFSAYAWSNGASTQTTQVSAASNYTVTVTNAANCTASDNILLTVNPTPVISLSDIATCDGTPATLDAGSGYNHYLWSNGNLTQTLQTAVVGTYSVTVSNVFSCTASDQITLTVNPLPVISLADQSICDGDTALLDAGFGFNTYLWSNGSTSQSVSATTSGIYTVTVTNGFNCADSDNIALLVNVLPVVNLADQAICTGASTTFDAGTGFAAYLWNDGSTTQSIPATANGVYSVTVSDLANCTATDNAILTLNALPVLNLADQTVCDGSIATFDAGAGFSGYYWNTANTTQTLQTSAQGSYSVTVTNASNCTASDTVELITNALPVLSLSNQSICSGDTATLNAGSGFSTYLWNDGSATSSLLSALDGVYTVTVTNADNCSASASITLTVNALPAVTLSDAGICQGGNAILDPGAGYAAYLWSDGSTAQTLSVVTPGSFSVTVTDANGCNNSATAMAVTTSAVILPADTAITANTILNIEASSGFDEYHWNLGSNSQSIQVASAGIYTVTATDAYGCTSSDSIIVSISTGLSPIGGPLSISLYPNPTSGMTTLVFNHFDPGTLALDVYTMTGQRCLAEIIQLTGISYTHSLNLEDLPSGAYMISVRTSGGTSQLIPVVKQD